MEAPPSGDELYFILTVFAACSLVLYWFGHLPGHLVFRENGASFFPDKYAERELFSLRIDYLLKLWKIDMWS